MQRTAPAYPGEGPHALWHFSETPDIAVFHPRITPGSHRGDALVWAVDTRHAPLFWFPRDCPRATAWATPDTRADDLAAFFGVGSPRANEPAQARALSPIEEPARSRVPLPTEEPARSRVLRLHAIEAGWLATLRACRLYRYRMPEATFAPDPEVPGYWLSEGSVQPLSVEPVGDLLGLHARAGIELQVLPSLWPLWARIVRSSLRFSGARLRNCASPQPDWVLPA